MPLLSLVILLLLAAMSSAQQDDWRSLLADAELTESQLGDVVLAVFQELDQERRYERAGVLEIHVQDTQASETFLLGNLFRILSNDPTERANQVVEFVRNSIALAVTELDPSQQSRVLPVIRDATFLESLPTSPSTEESTIVDSLTDDLRVLYVLDLPNRYRYLQASDLEGLGVARERLTQLAQDNLSALAVDLQVQAVGPVYLLTLDGNYESSVLLLDSVWDQIAQQLAAEPVVAIPARDLVLFASPHDSAVLASLREMAAKYERESGYAISASLLQRAAGSWKPYD